MQRRIAIGIVQVASLLLVLTSHLHADPLDSWKWVNAQPNGNTFYGVAYGGGLIVGVGSAGSIMTSTNLTTDWWTQVPMGTNTSTLNAITYGNGMFVIGAGDSPDGDKTKRFLTSTDGTNWSTQVWSNPDTRAVKALAYGAGLFVAGTERAQVWTSPDGTNWTQRYTGGNSKHNFNAVTYRPDVGFVAVGDSSSDSANVAEIRTSPDGIAWAVQTTGASASSLSGITWGWVTNLDSSVATNFVAVGSSGVISTSPDGTNWASQASGTALKLYAAAFKPGVGYIAVGTGGVIQTSPDGTNWTASWSDISNPVNVPGNDFRGATYAADLDYFIGVGSSGMVETSPTGVGGSWNAAFVGRSENLYGVTRATTNFVVVGNTLAYTPKYGAILTSPNGASWRVRNSNCPYRINNVAYGAGTLVAVANTGGVVSSVDEGISWTFQATGGSANITGVSYLTNSVTNIFLAVGGSGTILTSPDGTTWTTQTPVSTASTSNLTCCAYGAGTYVVAGEKGLIWTSPDCTTWTVRSSTISGNTRDIKGLAYGNNTFVAASDYSYVLTSPDGINWSQQTTPLGGGGSSSRTYSAIIYVNGQFVMAASTTTFPQTAILTSTNGTNWVVSSKPQTTSGFKALAYAPDTYMGVGNSGMIMQAGALTVARPLIQYAYDGTNTLNLIWSGGGTLQAAPDVSGTYTNVDGAASPWPITPLGDPSLFYRVRQP